MPTNENEKDNNKPFSFTSSSTPRNASFVCRSMEEEVKLSNTCLDPPSLVIAPIPAASKKPSPPRPPRSPKRARLADIVEERTEPETGTTEKGLVDLKSVLAGFISRLEAIPPPDSSDSPDSIYSHSTVARTADSQLHCRTRSLSALAEMAEHVRSRSASDGTFGQGSGHGHALQGDRETSTGTNEEAVALDPLARTLPTTPLLPASSAQSSISPLVLANHPQTDFNSQAMNHRNSQPTVPVTMPSLHITRPSTSSDVPEPHAFEAIVDMMNKKEPSRRPTAADEGEQSRSTPVLIPPPREGRAQIPRKGMMGPNAILAKVRSSSSLDKIKKQMSKPSLKFQSLSKSSSNNTTFLRPAPLPPPSSTYPARFAPTDYSRSNASSPSPSHPEGSFAMATPGARGSPARTLNPLSGGEAGEMVEIPRFRRKELNLALVRKRGLGQRVAWVLLWVSWVVNGLAGLFFDVNVIYMLIQCTIHATSGVDGPSRSWAFATAAYAICWGISIFVVWLGWEIYFEFWRKWRQARPAIEPIYTSLPASLHLSLLSYSHFTFLLHARMSSLSTPYRYDILPETAYALVQMLPGILPLLPRAGIAIVLLTTFSSPSARRVDKDERFFSPTGSLTSYARGVIFAFVAVVGFRCLVFLVSAIVLFLSSARPTRALFSHNKRSQQVPTTPTKQKTNNKNTTPVRDPALTRSPQKTWYEAETSVGWNSWRGRMRARIQDAYELCMIRRSGTGIGTMVDGSFIVLGGAATPSPRFNTAVRLGSRSVQEDNAGSVEELVESQDPEKAKVLSEDAVDDWLGTPNTGSTQMKLQQQQPENPHPSSSQSHSSPSTLEQVKSGPRINAAMRTSSNLSVSGYYTAGSQASHSSHDVFYTPASGNTPMFERAMPDMASESTLNASQLALRNMQDPSRRTLAARPESDVMGNLELLQDPHRNSQISTASDESIADDSAALLSTSSCRASEATSGELEPGIRSRSNSTTPPSQPSSRRSSVSRILPGAFDRSRAGSVTSGSHVLTRARSSSITLLREGAGAVQGVVRRARSGTVDGNAYGRIEGDETPSTLPRRRSKLGLGAPVIADEQRAVSG